MDTPDTGRIAESTPPPAAMPAAYPSEADAAAGRPTWSTWREALTVVGYRPHLSKTIRVALLVGTILFCINQLNVALGHGADLIVWLKGGLTYLVPFCVSNVGILVATTPRESHSGAPCSSALKSSAPVAPVPPGFGRPVVLDLDTQPFGHPVHVVVVGHHLVGIHDVAVAEAAFPEGQHVCLGPISCGTRTAGTCWCSKMARASPSGRPLTRSTDSGSGMSSRDVGSPCRIPVLNGPTSTRRAGSGS